MRLLAGNPLRYRRQILALKQFFASRQCTVLLLDDMTATDHDLQVQSIAHGVVLLEQLHPEYGVGAAPAAGRQVPRRAVPRRLSRLRHSARRASRSSRGWSRPNIARPSDAGAARQRRRRARRAARRRHRGRHQHADRRRGRDRQVDAGGAVRRGGRRARRARRRCSCSTRVRRRCSRAATALGIDLAERCRGRAWSPSSRSIRPSCRPGEFIHAIRRGRGGRREDRRHRQPERLPERDAGGAVPDHPAARAADVPRAARRRDDPDRRPSGPDRRRRCRRRSTPATWPTRSSCCATSKSGARCARRSR